MDAKLLLSLTDNTMNSEAFESCKAMTLDFIIKENDPEVAAVEDDVSAKRN